MKVMKMNIALLRKKSLEVADTLKILGHPKRLVILCCLLDGPKSVSELEKFCEGSQSQTSQFLKRMELEKLLKKKKDGHFIFYEIKDQKLVKLINQIKKIYC